MKKSLRNLMILSIVSGLLTFFLSRIFKNGLTEFVSGFFVGISGVFIIAGFVCLCIYHINRKYTYKTEKSNE